MAVEVPKIGSRVCLTEGRIGKVRWVGTTQFSNMEQLGVELDPGFLGENDGTLGGTNYFDCAYNRGVFILPEDVLEILTGKRRENVYKLQERVKLRTGETGAVRYIGNPNSQKLKGVQGKWYGIELDNENEKRMDGSLGSITYFPCKLGYGAWVQLHQIRVRLDLEEADLANRTRKSTISRLMVTVEIEDWPLGFMFKSNARVPEVLKVIDEKVQRRGLKPGMTLEWLNQKCVGHLSTAQTLERLTGAEFPLKLKFTQKLADGDIRGVPASPRGSSPASPRYGDGRSSSLNKRGIQLSKNIAKPASPRGQRHQAADQHHNHQNPSGHYSRHDHHQNQGEHVVDKRGHKLPKSPRKIITVEDPASMSPRGEVREDNKASLLQNQPHQRRFNDYENDSEGTEVEEDNEKDKNCIVM